MGMKQALTTYNQTMQDTTKPKSKFRHDINTLRAFAIAGVIFFHYKVKGFTGGFAGVDVFFVISGYLMSKIVLNSLNNNTFRFLDFYQKRIKRIIPALLFLISIISVACFFIYLPEDYKINQKNASASIIFLSNILYWKNSNYFDPVSDTNIFLHTWSLSVEWQFYLLYPIVLLALKKIIKKERAFIFIFSIITFTLFVISIIGTIWKPIPTFYLLPTRAWEMLMGGICLFAQDKISQVKWRPTLALTGYTVIFLSFIFLNDTMPWPSFYTLIPIAATSLVIICNYEGFEMLKSSGMQFIGSISYSLYLWHWPIYVISQYIGIEITLVSQLALCLLSIAFAYLSYKYIESADINSKLILAFSSIVFTFTALSSHFSLNRSIFKTRTLEVADYATNHQAAIAKQMNMGHCFIVHSMAATAKLDDKHCLCLAKNRKNILLIGDSHAAHLSEALQDSLSVRNINLLQAMASGGLPVLQDNGLDKFKEIIGPIYHKFIPANSRNISVVMISADWAGKKMETAQIINTLKETVIFLKKYGISTVIIGQNETYIIPYTTIAAKDVEYGTTNGSRYLNKDARIINATLKAEFKGLYVDIMNTRNFPQLYKGTIPYMMDENHFSTYGAGLATHKILTNPTVEALLGAGK